MEWVKHPRELVPKPAGKVKPLLVLDEIQKAKLWKRTLKGMYDGADAPVDILVTGSARLKPTAGRWLRIACSRRCRNGNSIRVRIGRRASPT